MGFYSFFQSLTSVCPISCHIFKTLNTISTASVFCGHTIHTFHVVFTQYAVSEHNAYIFLTDKLYLPTKLWIVFVVFTNVNTQHPTIAKTIFQTLDTV